MKYNSKFRRSGVNTNSGVYTNKTYQPEGPFHRRRSTQAQDILTEGGLRTLSKLEHTPVINSSKAADLSKSSNAVTKALPKMHD